MKLFTQAWYQRMAQIFGMNIASVEYVDNAIEESGGGGSGRVLDEWRPETVAGPAAFSQVADGYGEAVISNGGKTLTAAGGGLASTTPTAIPMDVEVGIALTMSEITDEGGAYFVFSNVTAIDPSANFLAVAVTSDGNGNSFCQIVNPFVEEGTTPVPITVTAESKLAFTILRETESTTVRFFTDADFAAPVAEYTFADVGMIDRFGIYHASNEAVEYNLIDGILEGFTYTPLTGSKEIASYPDDCAGRAYQLILSEPVVSPLNDGRMLNSGDSLIFSAEGQPLGYLVTPNDLFLTPTDADERYSRYVKNNYYGSGAPTEYNDETEGYSRDSKWYNTYAVPAEIYICTNASEGYAHWQLIPSEDLSGLGTMAYQEAGTGANQYRNNSANDVRYLIGQAGTLSNQYRNNSENDVRYLQGEAGTDINQYRNNSENDAKFMSIAKFMPIEEFIENIPFYGQIWAVSPYTRYTVQDSRTHSPSNKAKLYNANPYATSWFIEFKMLPGAGDIVFEFEVKNSANIIKLYQVTLTAGDAGQVYRIYSCAHVNHWGGISYEVRMSQRPIDDILSVISPLP